MKSNLPCSKAGFPSRVLPIAFLLVLIVGNFAATAQSGNIPLRRPVSTSSPMYIMHIDTWNYADPQKIINLIPADIRPYVVMNISLSISHDSATSRFNIAEYGYDIAKSWLRVCAQNHMWAMVQPASGGMHQFSDFDLSVYEEFYKNYPNFIGFNYAEQFWGFDAANDPVSAAWSDRMAHFANLLKLSNKYGGYLVVSWCGNQYSPNINPIGMMKRTPAFAAACRQYTKNYILCEKYTTTSYQMDKESVSLGAYLSGYSGNYGIRYDNSGWTDSTGVNQNFTLSTGSAPILEHTMLTGQTVTDGPEIIWTNCFQETGAVPTTNGYSSRNWTTFPQFDNISVDLFRKVLDGSVRIPGRQEVINRTKIAIINDVSSGSDDSVYSSPQNLFSGLYQMDNNYQFNTSFYKKTGRYPAIPTVFQLADATANSFPIKINKSTNGTRWPTNTAKVNEFNSLFPQEYTGDIYAGRNENGWVVYNPYKTNQIAKGSIPFKYNTSDSIGLSLSQYTSGVIKEISNQLKIYLNNYDNVINTGLKTNVITIYGSFTQPTWSYIDRASHQASSIAASWSGGVFTLTIQQNGPVDITINCAGTATGRLTSYTPATLIAPDLPSAYAGPLQYEAEIFDYKSISTITTSGYNGSIRNYTGQGYILFGSNAAAAIRKTVTVVQPGAYLLQTKYISSAGNITSVDLYVNGVKATTPTFTQTATGTWNVNAQNITLVAGDNTIEFRANASGAASLYFDNIVVSSSNAGIYNFTNDVATNSASNPPAYVTTLQDGTAGVVSYTDAASNTSNVLKAYSNGTVNGTGVVDLNLFASTANYSVIWKEYAGTMGSKKGILLRGSGTCSYAAGMKQGYLFQTINNANNTVTLQPYVANGAGISAKTAYTSFFTVAANMPCWYRATATGNTLKFECSKDSIVWEGGSTATFTDNTYTGGATQLLWGFGVANFSWYIDDITYYAPKLSSNKLALQGLDYNEGSGPSASQVVIVSGQSLQADMSVVAPASYEVSLSASSGYTNALTLSRVADSIPSKSIYVRLKAGLVRNVYKANLIIRDGDDSIAVALTGSVTGGVNEIDVYTFTNDATSVVAQNPPAANITVGSGNGATAGVISYTDAKSNTSNYLKVYGVGSSSNGTGVLNLNLFPSNAINYSVIWKQAILTGSNQYKNGVLLRANGTGGYTQGIMQGYLFNAFNNGSGANTAFRIYKSTPASSLSSLISNAPTAPAFSPASNASVWYRASVSGSTSVSLKFEYSTDSITWYTGASYTDNATPFTNGATQYVWGLAASASDFYLDNITFNAAPSAPIAADVAVSQTGLTGYAYKEGNGPSTSQSFTVSGTNLTDNIVISAPATFEISLNASTGFANTLTLPQTGGALAATTVYARMQAGLAAGSYEGSIAFNYASQPSVFTAVVVLRGAVSKPMIAVSPSAISDLGYVTSGPSEVRSFIVSGTTLSQNIAITAPTNFEVSLSSGSGYVPSLSLAPTNDTVPPTVIYVRLTTSLLTNTYNGTVALTSVGADNKSVPLGGAVAAQALMNTSVSSLIGFDYSIYSNLPPVKSFLVWGNPLAGDITVTAPLNFEISRTSASGYSSNLTLGATNGKVDSTIVYVRLRANLSQGSYSGNVTAMSNMASNKSISVAGAVSSNSVYDFTNDVATTAAANPPANNISVGTSNGATAGVVSYTDNLGATSNRLKGYSGGARNASGAMNLNLFPTNATDYSVTWKEAVGANSDYKVGVLLRGNNPVGTSSTGYVQGIMQGYLFIAYTAKGQATPYSQFRIYPSASSTSLSAYVNNQVALVPGIGQNLWYRASVSGSSPVSLKLEYSTDSITWVIGAAYTDNAATFTSGASQLVWGLGSANFDFYLDNITYASASIDPNPLTPFAGCPTTTNLALARPGYNAYNGEPTSMYNLDTQTGVATQIPGGPLKDYASKRNIDVNGAGVNAQDGFVYAIRDTINTAGTTATAILYRIGNDYRNVPVGTLPVPALLNGENLAVVNPAAGGFDGQGNYYYIGMSGAYTGGSSFTPMSYYIGKLVNVSAQAAGTGTLTVTWTKIDFSNVACGNFKIYVYSPITSSSGSGAIQDLAYSNLYKSLYVYAAYPSGGSYANQLLGINPSTGIATCYPSTISFGATNNEVAGISTTNDGSLMVFTTGGDIYKSNITNNTAYGVVTKIGTSGIASAGALGSIRGDLASCAVGPTTLPAQPNSIIVGMPNQIAAYPNPAIGITTITVGQPLSDAIVRLVSNAGNIILERTGVSGTTFKLDMTGKPGGLYIVEVIQGGNIQKIKIVK